ncbi:MAG: hypothetical protein AB7P07_05755 [Hyphomonadaceae bacterium]
MAARRLFITLALTLAACGDAIERAPLPEAVAAAAPVWFICDSVDAPAIVVLADSPEDGRARLIQYDKAAGAPTFEGEVALGQPEGAAGSVFTPIQIDGVEAGAIRQINPGMLENPGSAYTPPVTSVRFREMELNCRWMPRTRLLAFTERRSLLVYEGSDGDLIYTTFDFAAPLTPIDLTENGRSTTFSVETRDGSEELTPDGVAFVFSAREGFSYRVAARRDGTGALEVAQNGAMLQSEPLLAFQLGGAEE